MGTGLAGADGGLQAIVNAISARALGVGDTGDGTVPPELLLELLPVLQEHARRARELAERLRRLGVENEALRHQLAEQGPDGGESKRLAAARAKHRVQMDAMASECQRAIREAEQRAKQETRTAVEVRRRARAARGPAAPSRPRSRRRPAPAPLWVRLVRPLLQAERERGQRLVTAAESRSRAQVAALRAQLQEARHATEDAQGRTARAHAELARANEALTAVRAVHEHAVNQLSKQLRAARARAQDAGSGGLEPLESALPPSARELARAAAAGGYPRDPASPLRVDWRLASRESLEADRAPFAEPQAAPAPAPHSPPPPPAAPSAQGQPSVPSAHETLVACAAPPATISSPGPAPAVESGAREPLDAAPAPAAAVDSAPAAGEAHGGGGTPVPAVLAAAEPDGEDRVSEVPSPTRPTTDTVVGPPPWAAPGSAAPVVTAAGRGRVQGASAKPGGMTVPRRGAAPTGS